ncbi:MAG: DMT family transporter [Bacteroidales bacterium]|nr:DMT family transporter [Bacteroidales bacterium]
MAELKRDRGIINSYFFAIIAIIFWGFSFIWEGVLIKNDINIFTFIFERMVLASLILWVVGLIGGLVQKIQAKDMKWLFLLAFSEPFVYFLGENFGIKLTGSGVIAALIIATIPIFCLFAERLIDRTPISGVKMLGCFITLPAVFMVLFNKEGFSIAHIKGILFLFLAVVGAVAYTFFARNLVRKYNAYSIVTWQFTFGAILFFPLFLLFGREGITPEFLSWDVQSTILALAVLCSCLCFGLWTYATGKLGVTRVSIFSALIPAVSVMVAHFLYPGQESLTWLKIIGIAIAILGVILVQVAGEKKK